MIKCYISVRLASWRHILFCLAGLLLALSYAPAFGQVIDSFDDGDFTANPAWSGDTGNWQIETSNTSAGGATNSFTLRLNHLDQNNHTDYLSTQRTSSWGAEQSWGFWMGRVSTSGTSSVNQSYVWLWASESLLTSSTINGYRIHIGGALGSQAIKLERVDAGAATVIITSAQAIPSHNTGDYGILVRVTRTGSSGWTVYTSTLPTASGEGAIATDIPSAANTPNIQGSATDATYTTFSNGYLGFMAMHQGTGTPQTGAAFDQLYFDISASAPLPVELTAFSADISDDGVTLNWLTATETNNFGFEVQRKRLEGAWSKVGFVEGHGTTTSPRNYSFVDENSGAGSYHYRLKQIDTDGSFEYSKEISVTIGVPSGFELAQNYPNPFNPATTINYSLPAAGFVRLTVHDILGNVVRRLVAGNQSVGGHSILWNGKDDLGRTASSGIYFYSLEGPDGIRVSRRMLLMK